VAYGRQPEDAPGGSLMAGHNDLCRDTVASRSKGKGQLAGRTMACFRLTLRSAWPALALLLASGLHGCSSQPINVSQRAADHKVAIANVPATVVAECASKLNEKSFGTLGDAVWRFVEPLAPDDRFHCMFPAKFAAETGIRLAYFSARAVHVSGGPGKIGTQAVYWCVFKVDTGAKKVEMADHTLGFSTNQMGASRASQCGMPLTRAKTIFGSVIDGLKQPHRAPT
jgi:hypothetical protein